jgi:hypothetical protein
VPITTKAGVVDKDGTPRPGTTTEALAGLKPAFSQDGTVTAGTSSPLTDGASAILVTSEDYARAHGLPILARIKSVAVSGCQPEIMGIGPVEASRKALQRAGLTVDQLDVVELNEAFASQSLACISDLGLDQSKVNLDGGAIAIGHPLGATGARIGQGRGSAEARRRQLCACHPVHRRRSGHRHRAGGGGMSEQAIKPAGAPPETIKRSAIGAGVMGAGIAAQVANAGVPVFCSTSCPGGRRSRRRGEGRGREDAQDRSGALHVEGCGKAGRNGQYRRPSRAVAECDWIVEAIVERLDIKQALYAKLEQLKRPGTAVSSNTSTIPLGH